MVGTRDDQSQVETGLEDPVVLSVEGVSKKFCRSLKRSLFYGAQDVAGELLGARRQRVDLRPEEFWALDNLSFEVRRGEAIGLVGANGSGKTTLLRIISGLIRPDRGRVRVRGKVAPLIALGAGFSPVLTGRENVYANMSILGLSRQEIEDRFDQVVDFAELWDAIDAPVQSYSSGMAARLGFACAVHTHPDILLIDEVLSVGDVKFRAKCQRQLHRLMEAGTAFVLVSHAPQSLLNTCTSAIYIAKGRLIMAGETRQVLQHYEEQLLASQPQESVESPRQRPRSKGAIRAVYFRSLEGEVIEAPMTGKPVEICVEFSATRSLQNVCAFIAVYQLSEAETLALHLNGYLDSQLRHRCLATPPGHHRLVVTLPYLGLRPGSYIMKVFLKEGSLYTLDGLDNLRFKVGYRQSFNRGEYYQHRQWQVESVGTGKDTPEG
jgi:lipopolysaccharide transport system ATP-binding protein